MFAFPHQGKTVQLNRCHFPLVCVCAAGVVNKGWARFPLAFIHGESCGKTHKLEFGFNSHRRAVGVYLVLLFSHAVSST